MLKKYFDNASPVAQLILLLIITLTSWTTISILSSLGGVLIYGLNVINSPDVAISNPGYLKYFQTIQSIGLFILPPFIFSWLYSGSPSKELNIKKPRSKYIFLAILIIIVAQPMINFIGAFNYNIEFPTYMEQIESWLRLKENQAMEVTKIFLQTNTWHELVFNVFLVAILPAIGEELLFRGALQKIFTRILKNYHMAIWLTAFLFSLMHMQFFGLLPRWILGVVFGYLVVYGGNLWLAIAAHFTNNLLAFIIFQYQTGEGLEPLKPGNEYFFTGWVILSFTVVLITIYWLKKKHNKAHVDHP
jgi:membrane protease YdiL (CAAX protease family)